MKILITSVTVSGLLVFSPTTTQGQTPVDTCSPGPCLAVEGQVDSAVPIKGMADLHAHVFSEAAFSGRWFWGNVDTVSEKEEEVFEKCDADPRTHAGAGGRLFSNSVGEIQGITKGDTGKHKKQELPRWDTVAHIQYWEGHLKRAFHDGLKLMVMQAHESVALCQLVEKAVTHPHAEIFYRCDPDDAFDSLIRQIDLAKTFAAKTHWVEIAETPADARKIIGRGHMAWVLGIEADYMWGSERKEVNLMDRLKAYHDKGVRAMYISHMLNTKLAGAGLYFEQPKALQWIANCFYMNQRCNSEKPLGRRPPYMIWVPNILCGKLFGKWVNTYAGICDAEYNAWMGGPWSGGKANAKNGFCVETVREPVYGGGTRAVEKNKLGLTEDGVEIVNAMMDLGILIDIGHISDKAIDGVKTISLSRDKYPVYMSHAYFRDRLVDEKHELAGKFYNETHELPMSRETAVFIGDSGGMVGHWVGPDPQKTYEGSGVKNDCVGSTRSLAQSLAWGTDQGVKLAFATDFMGFARGVAPRRGGDGQCLNNKDDKKAQAKLNEGALNDFDERGLGHIGMIGPMVRDLEKLQLKKEALEAVRDNAAENFIVMWEKAYKHKVRK